MFSLLDCLRPSRYFATESSDVGAVKPGKCFLFGDWISTKSESRRRLSTDFYIINNQQITWIDEQSSISWLPMVWSKFNLCGLLGSIFSLKWEKLVYCKIRGNSLKCCQPMWDFFTTLWKREVKGWEVAIFYERYCLFSCQQTGATRLWPYHG